MPLREQQDQPTIESVTAALDKSSTGDAPAVQTPVSAGSTAPAAPAAAKTRILFVDDEPSMLRVLKLALRSMTETWDMEFVGSGLEAVTLVDQRKFDVVVTDMRMPDMNGAQLLNHVLRHHPHMVRIVLSGYADLNEVVTSVGLTHQFLEKPCGLDDLKDCLKRVTQLKTRLANDHLSELVNGLKCLPSLPNLYLEIAEALQSPATTSQHIAEIASQDPAIAAKMLQLANSAYFGFSREVYTVNEAVQLLGVRVIQSLALAVPIFSSFSRSKCPGFPIDQLWEHSLQTGVIGRRIFGQYLHDSAMGEQAFCSGMLHDIGKLILVEDFPEEYAAAITESRETSVPMLEVERKHFQATHAEVGAYLLALWGIPIPLVEAVANHHHPRRCGADQLGLAGVVHMANALQHSEKTAGGFAPGLVDMDYLKLVGLDRKFEEWRTTMAETADDNPQ